MTEKRARRYWLMKSEPDVYSYDTLAEKGRGSWDGVRNFVARNHLRAMAPGDLFLFYHSSCEIPGVVGIGRVASEAYADPTQFDPKSDFHDPKATKGAPRWSLVDVEPVERLRELVTLAALKAEPVLAGMLVVKKGMRLSVQPVEPAHFARILRMGRAKTKIAGA